MRVSIIAAVAENGVIGRAGKLPWHLPDDLRRFKELTMGHTIVMGRRTWESIGRPLAGRRMIVISRQADYRTEYDEIRVAVGLQPALAIAQAAGDDEAFIIGGAKLYREALPRADRIYLTHVHASVEGDVRFPAFDRRDWRSVESTRHAADDRHEYAFSFEVYERVE